MRIGVDFGTTRTVVASCDRGNYPVVTFEDETGNPVDFYPSVVAERAGELRFGFDALAAAAEPDWTLLRSFKRLLSAGRSSPDFEVTIGDTTMPGVELVARFLGSLREALLFRSNLPRDAADEVLSAVVATPANAHGTQRFLTLDAFRRAGFEVRGLLNEPSAAGFEYSHRYRNTITAKREHIVVYDLGGGTFDASLVHMTDRAHEAVITSGSGRLGGDDFDAVLAEMVLEAAKIPGKLPRKGLAALADQCREAKERLNPSSRRVVIDLESCFGDRAPAREVTVSVADYYDRCVPLVARTIDAMEPVMARLEQRNTDPVAELAGLYVVGGASALPVVGRVLRELFGRRVHRSPYPSAAIAMGLAIAGDDDAGFSLADRLSRHFGVFREADGGKSVVFDPIFSRDARVPSRGEDAVLHRRVYRPVHNVGRYRFVECTSLDGRGTPLGDITAYDDVLFPYDRGLREAKDLRGVGVARMSHEGPLIEEEYAVTPLGLVQVTIRDIDDGHTRKYVVGSRT
jgi:molecular chaperone DnaK (HSP70)